ncbi:uncharacterized protein YegP (UPF0339 family) [Flavobacterium nitrogenifigens]|uniref:Uncharacterized protein YegP (UPF0339 family) n=2 Tax=Flavobacterium TaxID=237 RepID=A0A7W7IYT3_9FLAO|nr:MULTISPECIES: hypothetical protein [Flavobacterium]MBB4803099.1 uncharacterized protein YegP (UPF0339 family) [Flavobacterium nitrogenifigens]MBB6388057.1 uncharacterized protein YegP (UPF0339 family) [Flavobacterium notoginsengisoli]
MKKSILLFGLVAILFISCKDKQTTDESTSITEESNSKPKAPKAEGSPRILFIGNSHTEFFVSSPIIFGEICKANNQEMNIDKLVTMGVSIEKIYDDHVSEAEANFAKKDKDGNYYDYVVLQESTPVALSELDKYKENVKMIVDKIHKNSPDVAIYIYEGMSPIPFTDSEYKEYYEEIRKNAVEIVKSTKNADLLRVGDAVNDAYNGKHDYEYLVANKDNLRYGENTLHLLNDGAYMQGALLFATIFGKKPVMPKELTLSTGTGDNDDMKKQEVSKAISNPKALEEIAFDNR